MSKKRDVQQVQFIKEAIIRASVREFMIPPVKDGLVLGKNSPIGCVAIRKALELLTPNDFEHIEMDDDEILSDIFIRKVLLHRVPEEKIVDFLLRHVKPMMNDTEILHLDLDITMTIEERI